MKEIGTTIDRTIKAEFGRVSVEDVVELRRQRCCKWPVETRSLMPVALLREVDLPAAIGLLLERGIKAEFAYDAHPARIGGGAHV